LNGTEKRIAVAVLDHFNRKTGRCDPSYETLAKLLRVHPRTIGRGVTKVVKVGFLKKVRHGGNNRCNSYRPPWELYRSLEERWKGERRQHADRFARQEVPSSPGQSCPVDRGEIAPQTYLNNSIPLTSPRQESSNAQQVTACSPVVSSTGGLGHFGARIQEKLGKEAYDAWFPTVHFVEEAGGRIILSAATPHTKSYIEQQFEAKILECFRPEYPRAVRIELVVRKPLV
jgi:hypothetical protein